MRTEDLINALVADLTVSKFRFRQVLVSAIALGAIVAAAAFLPSMGVRPDIRQALLTIRFLFKFVVTLSLAVSAGGLLYCLARPGTPTGLWAWALIAAPTLLVIAVVTELVATPVASWSSRMVGTNAVYCLMLIPLLSLGPLACIIYALRKGAPTNPGLAGAVAGLLASGIAATLYATHCTDDSPLFLATWYSLATGIVTLAGYAIGARALRW
ncbi:MAG: NrsF family protein [Methylocystis sp.]